MSTRPCRDVPRHDMHLVVGCDDAARSRPASGSMRRPACALDLERHARPLPACSRRRPPAATGRWRGRSSSGSSPTSSASFARSSVWMIDQRRPRRRPLSVTSPEAGRNHSAGLSVASAAAPAMAFSRSTASRRSALLPGSTSSTLKRLLRVGVELVQHRVDQRDLVVEPVRRGRARDHQLVVDGEFSDARIGVGGMSASFSAGLSSNSTGLTRLSGSWPIFTSR